MHLRCNALHGLLQRGQALCLLLFPLVAAAFYDFHLLFYDCDRIVFDATKPRVPAWLIHAAVFAWVWLLSWATFRWYETPFLRLKDRWGGRGEKREAVPLRAPAEWDTKRPRNQSHAR